MTLYSDYITGKEKSRTAIHLGERVVLYKVNVNFGDQTLDAGDGDVQEVLQLPAGSHILKAWLVVITAAPTNATCDLGYGDDTDQWADAAALDSTGAVESTLSEIPIYFSSTDTVDIKATTDTADVDIASGVVDVFVLALLP